MKMKSHLSKYTSAENDINSLSHNYLLTAKASNKKTTWYQVGKKDTKIALANVKQQIARELFNLSKVVDDGKFHVMLDKNDERELELN